MATTPKKRKKEQDTAAAPVPAEVRTRTPLEILGDDLQPVAFDHMLLQSLEEVTKKMIPKRPIAVQPVYTHFVEKVVSSLEALDTGTQGSQPGDRSATQLTLRLVLSHLKTELNEMCYVASLMLKGLRMGAADVLPQQITAAFLKADSTHAGLSEQNLLFYIGFGFECFVECIKMVPAFTVSVEQGAVDMFSAAMRTSRRQPADGTSWFIALCQATKSFDQWAAAIVDLFLVTQDTLKLSDGAWSSEGVITVLEERIRTKCEILLADNAPPESKHERPGFPSDTGAAAAGSKDHHILYIVY